MEDKKAKKIRAAWGDNPCEHPQFEKEYFLGSDTGDYICTQCGKVFSRSQKEKIENERHKK